MPHGYYPLNTSRDSQQVTIKGVMTSRDLRYSDIPSPVLHVAKTDDAEEGDPIIDCTISEQCIDNVSKLGLKLENSEVEEEDRYFDKVV